MLLVRLAGDLLRWMDSAADGAPRRVLLWLDPRSEFAGLVPLVDQALDHQGVRPLRLSDRRQQLSLKHELLRLDCRIDSEQAGGRVVSRRVG